MNSPTHPSWVMGHLERFLLSAPDGAVARLLANMDVWEIPILGKINTRLRCWFHGYSRRTWNFEEFLRLYFRRPATLLAMVDGKNAMIYGGAVLRFFLRCSTANCPIDICTTLSRYHQFTRFLQDDGFRLCRSQAAPWSGVGETIGSLLQRVGATHETWALTADNSWAAEDHIRYKFQYKRKHLGMRITVNLHLIRCEPYRHVLGGPITPLTCSMTGHEAFAPFARSTFRLGLAFTLRNLHLLEPLLGEHYVVQGSLTDIEFEVIRGPPSAFHTYFSAETGARHLGDQYSWVIPRSTQEPMSPVVRMHGPSFEVLDWNMIKDDKGTYMSIGEPFVWRYYYANRREDSGTDAEAENGDAN
ncbi:hypothetical protein DFP72DRAFT_851537 [Ephemerocybe angulata]|uniref:Uncharacterized protein n=1 Tax=Ephemerocybe angulata TaxID=980116 RepID=A0A8H6HS12_9AGAR|nr:hypothetical protein DFP72DRAFT_851537 [Tulosesus angulatus]